MILSPYAARSSMALRDIDEEPDPLRTAFQRDRDRIIPVSYTHLYPFS